MSHVVIAFKGNKALIVFQGTLEQAQAFQWSSQNADALKRQGFTHWQLMPRE